jgi:hypothetical protein
VSGGWKTVHVATDFGEDDAGAQLADAGDRGQQRSGGAKGLDIGVDLLVDLMDRRVDGVDLLEMQSQQEAVMAGHAAAQRCLQFVWRGFDPAVGQGRQSAGVGFAGDQRFDHPTTGQTHDVGDDRVELDVGVLQRLLQALDVAAALAHQLLAGAQQAAHLLGLLVRHETAPDQAVREKVGQPAGVVHVGLASRHVFDMRGVGQQ